MLIAARLIDRWFASLSLDSITDDCMLHRISRWTPLGNNTNHAGEPIPRTMDFFIPPPATIGKISSAYSNIDLTKPHPSPLLNISAIVVFALFAAMFGDVLIKTTGGNNPSIGTGRVLGSLFCGGIALWLGCTKLVVFPRCSYVGERGIAQFKQTSNSIQNIKPIVLLFQDVDSLFSQMTRSYYNGIYSGTSYEYKWGVGDRVLRTFSGYFYSWNNIPNAHHPWHFINAAESAWTFYLWGKAQQEYDRKGSVEFRMSKHAGTKFQIVRVGAGWLEFESQKEGANRVNLSDMKQMSLADGGFSFVHKDAKWLSSHGKFYFSYSSISNGRLFLICMEEIAMAADRQIPANTIG
jgi:hypothetical protein